ncbi:hypothetical protein C0Q70_13806 [Pomacea canaliculata]|uniref:Uncharacterized protein n=1 Tax=Pomacea canaliculata TaxID=400727 RepID=A0A2T7NY84_POMCA|nr:hypothetical protein C0Q70_13806 [Pomacea canaliculata]
MLPQANLQERVQGLTFAKRQFFLNGLPFRIISGAMHYFRVPEQYWRDRMKKMKACGLNTLETYVAWNLHEPVPGKFNYKGMLNLRKYLELAYEMGFYVILRPGPYICSEWDWGGMPSWLLADPNMKVRSNYKPYQDAVTRFFANLLPQVVDLQFTQGGPIIAVQVENEFGAYSNEVEHLDFLKDLLRANGIKELLVTSDGAEGNVRIIFYNSALPTANFKEIEAGQAIFNIIKQENPDFPLMVMEFWTGWFDHWGQPHSFDDVDEYEGRLSKILETGASINFYMFHGGTNFGFMAGANNFFHYKADVTSYGAFTAYSPAGFVKKAISHNLQPMEMYQFDMGIGQSYGYIIYRKQIGSVNKISLPPRVHDYAQVLLNSDSVAVFDSDAKKLEVDLRASQPTSQLDIIVENLGRVNFIKFDSNLLNEERKGLAGDVMFDGKVVTDWTALALDFDEDFLEKVSKSLVWRDFGMPKNSPVLCRAYLEILDEPKDTFVNTMHLKKGIVIVNGHNLGRYWDRGPQRTLYLPAPFLKKGKNEVLVFQEFSSAEFLSFDSEPQLG